MTRFGPSFFVLFAAVSAFSTALSPVHLAHARKSIIKSNSEKTSEGKTERQSKKVQRAFDLAREPAVWRKNATLRKHAQKLEPLSRSNRPGAQGTNRTHPERVLLRYQSIGLEWIRLGLIEENGFVVDRGVSCFEWGLQAVGSDGTFGQSTYTETVDFLGRYAHAVLLLKAQKPAYLKNRLEAMLKLLPYLEQALNSPVLLKAEKQWDRTERMVRNSHARAQAASAAYWLAQLKVNPKLAETSTLWIDELLSRQLPNGRFQTQLKSGSKAETAAMTEIVRSIAPLALADPVIQLKVSSAMKLLLKGFSGAETKGSDRPSVEVAKQLIQESLKL